MTSLLNKQWKIKHPYSQEPLMVRVCQQRKVKLDQQLTELHDPWLLKDMEKAVKRTQEALEQQQRIMIFGDYDVDGVSGASMLYLGLKKLGAKVSVRLPHRERDGYGLNTKVLDECQQLNVSLLITVDCGISNREEIAYGADLGLDIIVTDHHRIPPILPDKALAILNPHQEDCTYPEKDICGSVVAYKFLCALYDSLGAEGEELQSFLDMAALATVADCMPLSGENRLIVQQGLQQMQQTQHRGLRSLLESYQLTGPNSELKSYHLGFNIAPCINAAGRLEDPLTAFKMMIGDSAKALELRQLNEERQNIVQQALQEASEQVERDHKDDPILIFWQDHWPPGIVGLLAGRLCERYHKPVICLTRHEDKYVGSCRSIPQLNIVDQLQQIEELFLNYGGHSQAAGLSILPDKLEQLRNRLMKNVGAWLQEHPVEATLLVDTEIHEHEISLAEVDHLQQLEPFGMGNPKPKFLLRNLEVLETRVVGKNREHLQLQLQHKNSTFKGIAFRFAEFQHQMESWKHVDVICQLNKNSFRNQISVDLQVQDARPALDSSPLE